MKKQLKPILLIGNSFSPDAAGALKGSGLFNVIDASIGKFGSDEPFTELMQGEEARYDENLAHFKGSTVYILQSTARPVSDNFKHLLLLADTAKLYGAAEVVALEPFAADMRQDRPFKNRFTSVAAGLDAKLYKTAGVDRIVTFTPHSEGAIALYEAVFGDMFTALNATGLFAADITRRFGSDPATLAIGAPDGADKAQDQGQKRARELAVAIFGFADEKVMFGISKTHTGVSDTRITGFTGDVSGKDCVVVDDMIDGGSTMINAASLLKSRGAKSVTCYATHGILSGNALEKLLLAKNDGMNNAIDKLVITDTVPDARDKLEELLKRQPRLAGRVEILSTGPTLVQEVERQMTATAAATVTPLRRKHAPGP
jgi:ribose-phosphate pyrophosphokinase